MHRLTPLLLAGLLATPALAAPPTLTVYTYSSFASDWGPGPGIERAFEARCSCDLKFVALEDGVAILNRLKLEGEHSPADVVIGMDDGMLADARASHLLPGGWQDATFLPFDYGYFAFVYDSSKLATPPKSLKELVARQDLRVLYEDPRTSTPGQGLLLWMKQVFGSEAPAAWEQLAGHTVSVTKGWSEAYGMLTWCSPIPARRPTTASPSRNSNTGRPCSTRATTARSRWPPS